MGLYYRIWVDLIKKGTSLPQNKQSWKLVSFSLMSLSMTLNFALTMAIIQKNVIGHYIYDFEISFLPHEIANIVRFTVLFIFPVVALNYIRIFHKDRYKKLLQKYPSKDGKLFFTYFLISMLLPLVFIWTGIILSKLNIIQ